MFRFTVPMGPDGSAVVFVASSIYAERKQTTWDAFIFSANGYFVPLAKDVEFVEPSIPSLYLRGSEAGQNAILSEIALQRNEYSVLKYTIENGNNLVTSRVSAGTREKQDTESSNDEDEIAAKLGLGGAFQRQVEKILLSEFLANPDSPWRRVSLALDLNSQILDPADRPGLELAKMFDQSEARARWKQLDRELPPVPSEPVPR